MFQDYEQTIAKMTDNLKKMNKIRFGTILKFIFGWFCMCLFFFVPGIIMIEPSILPIPDTFHGIPTEKLVRFIAVPCLFIGVVSSFIFLGRTYIKFRCAFRDVIVKEVVRYLMESYQSPKNQPGETVTWSYGAGRKISSFKISRSGLFFLKKGDRFVGGDRIKGTIGLTDFDFSTLTLYKRVTSSKQSERYKMKRKFEGVLFLADFNKNFRGHTLLRDKKIKSFRHLKRYIWLMFNRLTRGKALTRIHLENKDFDRRFKTKTSDEVEARYILTPNLMERIVSFSKKRRNPIDISFRHNHIAIALSSKKYFFEPSIFGRMKNRQVKEVYDDLIFFFSIIEELNLNTRIWSKQ